MASSYTTSLKLTQIGNGEQSGVWGTTTNTNWSLIEQAVSGVQTITMSNANYTLSNLNGITDEARNMVLVVNGTNSAIYQVIIPSNQPKFYIVSNQTTGGYAITIGAATGSVVSIPNGITAQVYTDGTNCYSAQTGSAGSFLVNGTLTASGVADVGNLSVSGTTTLTGTATAPTPTAGDNTTKIATTAFVQNATAGLGTMATQNANAVAITGGTEANVTYTNATISSVSTPITAAQGGTGSTSLTANNVILGNGTSAVQTVAPGTSGNVLTSNGTTWASTTPSIIGSGQSWTNVLSSRASGTTYTNSTGKPIMVSFSSSFASQNNINVYVDSVQIWTWGITNNYAVQVGTSFIVPNGSTYSITAPGGLAIWAELR